jgi:hypothetical protein
MAKPFPTTEPAWALRSYLVLIGCAADRQTVTYDDLARRVKRGGPNLLAKPLALITRWCVRHDLTALASLVVERATRLPLPASPLSAETRFLASKNAFGILIGMRFCRRQSRN